MPCPLLCIVFYDVLSQTCMICSLCSPQGVGGFKVLSLDRRHMGPIMFPVGTAVVNFCAMTVLSGNDRAL